MRAIVPSLPLFAAVALGCAASSHRTRPVELSGRYTAGFEASRFSSCDAEPADRPWWVTLSATALRQRDSLMALLPAEPGAELFVRWRGVVGAPATAGHLGQSTRYVFVTDILELRPAEASDCGRAAWGRLSFPPAT